MNDRDLAHLGEPEEFRGHAADRFSYTPATPDPEPFVLTVGDIGVTRSWVSTPNGSVPLSGSQWIVTDRTSTATRIPAYAIVLAIIFFVFCLLGLLFLLIKETTISGYVEVSVRNGHLYHVVQIPVHNQQTVEQVRRQVHQAQSMAANAPRM